MLREFLDRLFFLCCPTTAWFETAREIRTIRRAPGVIKGVINPSPGAIEERITKRAERTDSRDVQRNYGTPKARGKNGLAGATISPTTCASMILHQSANI